MKPSGAGYVTFRDSQVIAMVTDVQVRSVSLPSAAMLALQNARSFFAIHNNFK